MPLPHPQNWFGPRRPRKPRGGRLALCALLLVTLVTPIALASSSSTAADVTPPTTPQQVLASSTSGTSIAFTWKASTDNSGAVEYLIWWNASPLTHTPKLTYTKTGLKCGTPYTFAIAAQDAAGNRSAIATVLATTQSCGGDTIAPTAPTAVTVTGKTATSVSLSWPASTDNVGVAGYDATVNGTVSWSGAATSATVGGLTCNTSYTLGVRARDAAGNTSSVTVATASTAACTTPPPPPPPAPSPPPTPAPIGTPTVFVAVNGNDLNPCTASAPCATFGRAYLVARAGDFVQVAGGIYATQVIPFDATKTSTSLVTFQPAPGAAVTMPELDAGNDKTGVGAKHFEVRGMTVTGYVRVGWGTQDVTLRNIVAGGLDFTSTRNVRVLGGSFGPRVDGVSHINACGVSGCFPAQDILIDGALFHDYTITDPAKHAECLMMWPGLRVTIRNTTFRNCTDFDLLVKPYNTALVGLPGSITLENNFFDAPMPGNVATASCSPGCARSGAAVAMTQGKGESWNGVTIRYNSLLADIRVDSALTGVSIVGNVGTKPSNYSCQTNASFAYNVWTNAKCSSTDRMAPLTSVFVNPTPGSFDLHALATSPSINAGDPASYPATDIDGQSRPAGGVPDSGADEKS